MEGKIMYQKIISVTLFIMLISVLLVGCGTASESHVETPVPPTLTEPEPTATNPATHAPEKTADAIKACLVVQDSDVDIDGFNKYSYDGMQNAAKDYDIESTYFISDSSDDTDAEAKIQDCLDFGANIIITVSSGGALVDFTAKFAEDYPDVYFIGVDHFVENGPKNYVGIQAHDDQGGFLAGYLAGLVTESNVVAGIYGPPYPALVKFRNGYEQGAKLAAKELGKEIETLGIYLDSFSDPETGAATALDYIEQGADVVFGAAGLTGTGAIVAAAEKGVYVIGVDQDEYYTSFEGGNATGAEYIISSAVKHVNVGVYDTISAIVEEDFDTFPGGSNYYLSVENGGLSFAGKHDADISDELYDKVAETEARLTIGDISTGVDSETGEVTNP